METIYVINKKEYDKGWYDYSMGKSINSCPDNYDVEQRRDWSLGWLMGCFAEEDCNPIASGGRRFIE